MDLSHSLSKLTHFLIKNSGYFKVGIAIHEPKLETFGRWLIILRLFRHDGTCDVCGSGISKSLPEAYYKAVSELGEELICVRDHLDSRCGLSGGWLLSETIARAKCELLERDAFLFHYRGGVSFEYYRKISSDLLAFRLKTLDEKIFCCLVTNEACANGDSECLLFGTAAHTNPKISVQKALHEYVVMHHGHAMMPARCKLMAQQPNASMSIMDQHHIASRDYRNLKKFKELCKNRHLRHQEMTFRSNLNCEWKITLPISPVRFLKYAHVYHEELLHMEFGIPEVMDNDDPKTLLHPFW